MKLTYAGPRLGLTLLLQESPDFVGPGLLRASDRRSELASFSDSSNTLPPLNPQEAPPQLAPLLNLLILSSPEFRRHKKFLFGDISRELIFDESLKVTTPQHGMVLPELYVGTLFQTGWDINPNRTEFRPFDRYFIQTSRDVNPNRTEFRSFDRNFIQTGRDVNPNRTEFCPFDMYFIQTGRDVNPKYFKTDEFVNEYENKFKINHVDEFANEYENEFVKEVMPKPRKPMTNETILFESKHGTMGSPHCRNSGFLQRASLPLLEPAAAIVAANEAAKRTPPHL
ncbi:hypothetical protein Tco_0355304 [Tanacetum coccineum]